MEEENHSYSREEIKRMAEELRDVMSEEIIEISERRKKKSGVERQVSGSLEIAPQVPVE